MAIRIVEEELPKLRDFLLERFETSGDLNVFLQKFMWPAYRFGRNSGGGRHISPAFRELDGSEISVNAVTRALKGAHLLQCINGEWWEVEKRRGGLWHPLARKEGSIRSS